MATATEAKAGNVAYSAGQWGTRAATRLSGNVACQPQPLLFFAIFRFTRRFHGSPPACPSRRHTHQADITPSGGLLNRLCTLPQYLNGEGHILPSLVTWHAVLMLYVGPYIFSRNSTADAFQNPHTGQPFLPSLYGRFSSFRFFFFSCRYAYLLCPHL